MLTIGGAKLALDDRVGSSRGSNERSLSQVDLMLESRVNPVRGLPLELVAEFCAAVESVALGKAGVRQSASSPTGARAGRRRSAQLG